MTLSYQSLTLISDLRTWASSLKNILMPQKKLAFLSFRVFSGSVTQLQNKPLSLMALKSSLRKANLP